MNKIVQKNNILKVVVALSVYISYLLCFYMYDATKGPDYLHYFNYSNYFFGIEDKSLRHSGSLYYYLHSLVISMYQGKIISTNFGYIQSEALIITNHFLFVIGIIGLYKYFQSKKFNQNKILIALIILNFTPFIFQLKLSLKPEILGFAFFPWVILSLDQFLTDRKFTDFILFLASFSLILTSKASIALMIALFIFLLFRKQVFTEEEIKTTIFATLSLLAIVFIIYIENFSINDIHIYNNVSYNNVEPFAYRPNLRFFFSFNVVEFLKYPHIYSGNASSIYRIIMLDSFNDYYHLWWNYDKSLFNNFSIYKDWFSGTILNQIINYQLEYYISSSIFILYLYGLVHFRKFDKFILYCPLIGILVLVVNSLGIPSLNFNPEAGDIFKTIYYSFFASISFTYLLILFLQKLNNIKILFLVFTLLMSFSFIYGFPKDLDKQRNLIQEKTSASVFCEANNLLLKNNNSCKDKIINLPCGDQIVYVFPDKRTDFQNDNFIFPVDDRFKSITLQKGSDSLTVSGYAECFYYKNNGYLTPYKFSNLRVPIINLIVFIIFLYSAFIFSVRKKN